MSVRNPATFMEQSQNKSQCLQIASLLLVCVFLSCLLMYSDYFVYTIPAPMNSCLLYCVTLSTEHRQCFLQASLVYLYWLCSIYISIYPYMTPRFSPFLLTLPFDITQSLHPSFLQIIGKIVLKCVILFSNCLVNNHSFLCFPYLCKISPMGVFYVNA